MTIPRFDGAQAWACLDPEQQAAIGAVAMELAVANLVASLTKPDEPRHRAAMRGGMVLVELSLRATFKTFSASERLQIERDLPVPSLIGVVCRRCGCSQEDACEGGCSWAEADLCTACVDGAGRMRARQARVPS